MPGADAVLLKGRSPGRTADVLVLRCLGDDGQRVGVWFVVYLSLSVRAPELSGVCAGEPLARFLERHHDWDDDDGHADEAAVEGGGAKHVLYAGAVADEDHEDDLGHEGPCEVPEERGIRSVLHVTSHTSHVTRHTSHVTRHTSRRSSVLVLHPALEQALRVRLEAQAVANLRDGDGEQESALSLLEHVRTERCEADALGHVLRSKLRPVLVLAHQLAEELQALVALDAAAERAHGHFCCCGVGWVGQALCLGEGGVPEANCYSFSLWQQQLHVPRGAAFVVADGRVGHSHVDSGPYVTCDV